MTMTKLMSTQEVADYLNVDRKTVLRYLQSGRLKGRKLGREYRIPEDAVRQLVQPVSSERTGEATVIALANQKGGVAKSTTAFSLAAALHRLGHSVLMIDMDPQASLSITAGIDVARLKTSIYNLLIETGLDPKDAVLKTLAGPDIIPSTIDLSGAELELDRQFRPAEVLKTVVADLRPDYDFILIDCPPSLGNLTLNGLAAADEVIIPIQCEFLATRGLALLLKTVEKIQQRINRSIRVTWILPTMYHERTVHAREVLEELQANFPGQVFSPPIKHTVKVKESPAAGMSIIDYDPEGDVALAYMALAKEVSGDA